MCYPRVQESDQSDLHVRFSKARMQKKEKPHVNSESTTETTRNATLQLRVDEELKNKFGKYAEFLDSTESYVVSEALKLVFNKDAEFKEWLERQERE